jgi:hypothetical protein
MPGIKVRADYTDDIPQIGDWGNGRAASAQETDFRFFLSRLFPCLVSE